VGTPRTPGPDRDARRRQDEVVGITAARPPLSQDIAARNRRYMLQMSTRVVCFLGAVAIDHWVRWVLLVGAVLLPYTAVVLANAGRERGSDPGTLADLNALPAAPGITLAGTDRHDGGPQP
jgi:hypothetical protein